MLRRLRRSIFLNFIRSRDNTTGVSPWNSILMKQLVFTILIVVAIIVAGSILSGILINKSMSSQEIEKQARTARQTNKLSRLDENQPTESPEAVLPAESSVNQPVPENIIVYSDSGYSPSKITIKTGDKVIFKNESSDKMWTASAVHPFHSVYSGTSLEKHCPDTEGVSFDECEGIQPGESWSFKFDKKGEWGYHNHLETSHFGKIIVE